jgi:hypothetical protein
MFHEVITNISQEIILKVMKFFYLIAFLSLVSLIGITCKKATIHDKIINKLSLAYNVLNHMKYRFTPESFNNIAITLSDYRWKLLAWSVFAFILFLLLNKQINYSTPTTLVWLAIFILFAALQALVVASFIFFFQNLPSNKAENKSLIRFYRTIEWCEAIIFTIIFPLPMLLFFYALIVI